MQNAAKFFCEQKECVFRYLWRPMGGPGDGICLTRGFDGADSGVGSWFGAGQAAGKGCVRLPQGIPRGLKASLCLCDFWHD